MKPQVLLALLTFVLACGYLLGSLVTVKRRDAPPLVELASSPEETLAPSEVRLVLYDATGLERPGFTTLALPEVEAERLLRIVEALQLELALRGVWPDGLPVPLVYVEHLDGRRVAVLDFDLRETVSVTVAVELQLLRSIQATVLANAIDRVRILTNGVPRATFLGHVALPQTL